MKATGRKVLRWVTLHYLLLSPALCAQSVGSTIDLAAGVIDGKKALGVWVTDSIEGDVELLDSSGFTVHLVPFEDLDSELVFPCGEWFSPPAGSYLILVEGPDSISPTLIAVHYGASPFDGRGMPLVDLVVPAGKVKVDIANVPASTAARIVHLESHRRHPEFQKQALNRRATLAAVGEGVLMPTGPVIVALVDPISEDYLAVSPPTEIIEGQTVTAVPVSPSTGESAVVAVIRRPRLVGRKQEDDLEVTWLDSGGRSTAPDVLVRTSARLLAFWYQLSGSGRLIADSPTMAPRELGVDLVPGKIHRLDLKLEEGDFPNPGWRGAARR